MSSRVKELEDVQQNLDDFSVTVNELKKSLKKTEDKLSAHLSLGSAANDQKHAERILVVKD